MVALLLLKYGGIRKRKQQCASVSVIVAIRIFPMSANLLRVELQVVDVREETRNTMVMAVDYIGFGKR